MTATQITGGSVKYTSPSNYNTGKDGCEVTIHFAVADGDGAGASAMGDMARTEAVRLAIGADRPYVAVPQSPGVPAAPVTGAATPIAAVGAASMPVVEPVPPTPAPAPTSTSSGPMSVLGTTAAPAADTSAPDVSTPSASPVSDAALIEAATHHASRVCNPPSPQDPVSREVNARKVGAVIAEYVRPPQKLVHIPAEKRQEFLDKLAAL